MRSFPPPSWLHALGQMSRRRDALDYERAAGDPQAAQAAFLGRLLQRHADTAYGRQHGFAGIASPEAYAEKVPLMTPADMQVWVRRTMAGERRLLTPEDPVFYGMTAGTSGQPKCVPVTPTYRKEFQRTVSVSFWHVYRRFPQAFRSRFLYFVGKRHILTAPDGLEAGNISGFNYKEMSPLIRRLYAWPQELFDVADMATRDYLALYLAIVGDISLITGIFPLGIVTLLRRFEGWAETLAWDLERGRLDGAPGLGGADAAPFTAGLQPRPDLARRVREAARRPVEEQVGVIWPQLRLAYCWMAGGASLYVPELRRRLGPQVTLRDAIYSSTEAWCNVAMGDDEPGGPLALTSAYYEFIDERDYQAGSTRTVPLSDLEDGGRYLIVLSASSGAFRYVLGDVIEVCGAYLRTPRIRFVRKFGVNSNIAGELLDEGHITTAVGQELADAAWQPTWFCLVGEPDDETPGYSLYVEAGPGTKPADRATWQAFADRIDGRLQADNHQYGVRRRNGILRPVAVKPVPEGSYARWKVRRMAEGSGDAQLKTVHLVASPADLPTEFTPG
jgi:hypothetical protein